MMKLTTLVILTCLFPWSFAGRCSVQRSRREIRYVTYAIRGSQKYYTSCGFWGMSTCARHRDVYSTGYRPESYTTYYREYVCCPGWTGSNCNTAVCSRGCYNGACTAPDVCSCRTGWQGSTCGTDTNECASYNGGCSHYCVNTDGSYYCTCRTGYSLSGRHTCYDINECSSDNGDCDHQCHDTSGSFYCTCDTGYSLYGSTTCIGTFLTSTFHQNCSISL
ncbi:epidermal growth factor-like protein 7 isoform X1 [Branchiostoma floridae x Branchiostoma japonicum]